MLGPLGEKERAAMPVTHAMIGGEAQIDDLTRHDFAIRNPGTLP